MTQNETLIYIADELKYLRQKVDTIDASVKDINTRLIHLESEVAESRPLVSRYKSYLMITKDVTFFAAILYSLYNIMKDKI